MSYRESLHHSISVKVCFLFVVSLNQTRRGSLKFAMESRRCTVPHERWQGHIHGSDARAGMRLGTQRMLAVLHASESFCVRFSCVPTFSHFNWSAEIWRVLTSAYSQVLFCTFSICAVWKVTSLPFVCY